MRFELVSDFKPTGDQPQAIEKLVSGIKKGSRHQVLLGVTGSGKTFTMCNLIQNVQKPTLVISHNKTLAAQLYQEFREFFPKNAVSYFVSYYDYYQPEAYIPHTDTYIAKETDINELIDKLRLEATTNLLTRKDTIIVASVSCIYNIGSPREYGNYTLELRRNQVVGRKKILENLVRLHYDRNDFELRRGTFRAKGDTLEIWPSYKDYALKVLLFGDRIEKISKIDPITGGKIEEGEIFETIVYPAKHYMVNPKRFAPIFEEIRAELKERVGELQKMGKELEANRLTQRVNYDLEMIQETGFINGIENYSRYFDGRAPGEPPYTLLDYFHYVSPNDFLVIIDESHMTVPQIRGMHQGDLARKKTLIDYGFRLPSCLDNRPLRIKEFLARVPQVIYTSATPDDWEIKMARSAWQMAGGKKATCHKLRATCPIIEQLIRPTGLIDPEITIRPIEGQVDDLILEIEKRTKKRERALVTTLTKRMAEALSEHLNQRGIKTHHLHADIKTLDRSDILEDLRRGKYDAVVGINLLREGLDLPEVSLVAILDADKEGFLRSKTSLIQVMGRAARHVNGLVIMYSDTQTSAMREAIKEVRRRRQVQLDYNKKYRIKPKTITKPIRKKLIEREEKREEDVPEFDPNQLTPDDKKRLAKLLLKQMRQAARELEFEKAAVLRDKIKLLENERVY